MDAYYNHVKLVTKHFIPKVLLAIESITDIMKRPVTLQFVIITQFVINYKLR